MMTTIEVHVDTHDIEAMFFSSGTLVRQGGGEILTQIPAEWEIDTNTTYNSTHEDIIVVFKWSKGPFGETHQYYFRPSDT